MRRVAAIVAIGSMSIGDRPALAEPGQIAAPTSALEGKMAALEKQIAADRKRLQETRDGLAAIGDLDKRNAKAEGDLSGAAKLAFKAISQKLSGNEKAYDAAIEASKKFVEGYFGQVSAASDVSEQQFLNNLEANLEGKINTEFADLGRTGAAFIVAGESARTQAGNVLAQQQAVSTSIPEQKEVVFRLVKDSVPPAQALRQRWNQAAQAAAAAREAQKAQTQRDVDNNAAENANRQNSGQGSTTPLPNAQTSVTPYPKP